MTTVTAGARHAVATQRTNDEPGCAAILFAADFGRAAASSVWTNSGDAAFSLITSLGDAASCGRMMTITSEFPARRPISWIAARSSGARAAASIGAGAPVGVEALAMELAAPFALVVDVEGGVLPNGLEALASDAGARDVGLWPRTSKGAAAAASCGGC